MRNLRTEIRNALLEAVLKVIDRQSVPEVIVQYPPGAQEVAWDYASPIALIAGKLTKKNPMKIAEEIISRMTPPEFIEKAETAAPGFINFKLKPEWLASKLNDIVENGNAFGSSNLGEGKTVNLEFVSANPTGMPTFGNGRALFWADSLGRVLERSGYAVTREYYINDVGNQVNIYGESILRRILQNKLIEVPYAENLYQGEEVKEIARKVEEIITEETGHKFSEKDLENAQLLKKVSNTAVETTVASIKTMLEDICKVKYDIWYSERTVHERGDVKKVMEDLKERNETFEKDGALWFSSTKYGDDKDRVLVRENGEVTYFVADIAYHRDKFARGYNIIADFWGADHYGYVARMKAALKALGEDTDRLKIVITQIVHVLEDGKQRKMSKRAGTAVPLSDIVSRAGLSASRFFLTMASLSSQMEFDLELAKEQSDRNPVFYVQYAYVRLASILRKAKELNILDGDINSQLSSGEGLLTDKAEALLMRQIFRFPEVVEDVAENWEVQRLPHFAIEFARSIHFFYDTVQVLSADNKDLLYGRLTLALAAKTALGNLLDLLGVEKLEVM